METKTIIKNNVVNANRTLKRQYFRKNELYIIDIIKYNMLFTKNQIKSSNAEVLVPASLTKKKTEFEYLVIILQEISRCVNPRRDTLCTHAIRYYLILFRAHAPRWIRADSDLARHPNHVPSYCTIFM